jgi:putative alpha-1,2-mannosidase
MSAWYVMSAMGFYAVDPISGSYVFGTPLFDKVTIDLGRTGNLSWRPTGPRRPIFISKASS